MDDEAFRNLQEDDNETLDNAVSPSQSEADDLVETITSAEDAEEVVNEPSATESSDYTTEVTEYTLEDADEDSDENNLDISRSTENQAEQDQDEEISNGEKTISSDLIRGHINTIILRSLYDGDKYGYAIIAEIERKSHKQYQLKQPSLYSALKRLEKDGYITSYWGGSVGGGRRKYFSLTDQGKAIAERNQMEWEYSRTVIDSLISDRDFDFKQPAPTPVDMRVLKQSTSRVPSGIHDDDFFDEDFDEEPIAISQPQTEDESITAQRMAFEADRLRVEEMLRAREEALRADEEATNLRAEEQARLLEELRIREENLRAREDAIKNQSTPEPTIATSSEQPATVASQDNASTEQPATVASQDNVSTEQPATVASQDNASTEQSKHRYWNEWRAMEAARLEEEAYMRIQAEAAAKARYEEELRRKQLALQLDEQKKLEEQAEIERQKAAAEHERLAEEETQRTESKLWAKEQSLQEKESRLRAEEIRLQEERARVLALNDEKERQNARILETQTFLKEREQYEREMEERETALRAHYENKLAKQEEQIRLEAEEEYRQREQELLHKNYLNLVNTPRTDDEKPDYSYFNRTTNVTTSPDIYATKPEEEREYRSIIQKLYESTIKPVSDPVVPPAPQVKKPIISQPIPTTEKPVPTRTIPQNDIESVSVQTAKIDETRSLDGIDFYDLETRAAQDGIRITTSGARTKTPSRDLSANLVHKGKALFFSALIVFLICLAEGSVTLGLLRSFDLPRVYPFLIWGTGLAVLLITGLSYLNHYGERALRQTGNFLVNSIVTYALCIVIVLILALAMQIDFSDVSQLMSNVIIPIIFLLNIVVFAVAYYLQIKPKKD